jgi:predicted peptidase
MKLFSSTRLSFVLLMLCGWTNLLSAQEYEAQYFSDGSDTLSYRILYPLDYDTSQKDYPLLVFLHGSGERGNDNEAQLTHGAQLFIDSLAKYPAIVVFPQCPKEGYWAEVEWNDNGEDIQFPFYEKGRPSLEMVIALIDQLKANERIDEERLYLGGLSMGGFGTFDLLARLPNTFEAAIPICGGGNPLLAPLYASNTRLWIFHGEADSVVPVGLSRKMYQALKEAGADVKYTEYTDVDHNSWDNAFAEPGFFEWLFRED